MFVGKEDLVYSVLPVSTEKNLTYVEAIPQENAKGFQFRKGHYHAVTYHDGVWVPMPPFDLDDYYAEQVAEWTNAGMSMSWKHRFAYFRLYIRCSTSYHAQFGLRIY